MHSHIAALRSFVGCRKSQQHSIAIGMAHISRSIAERSALSQAVGSAGATRHSELTPRVYAFQPRKGRLNTRSIAQVDVQHIITNSDHAMLQQCLREVVFGKVRDICRYQVAAVNDRHDLRRSPAKMLKGFRTTCC